MMLGPQRLEVDYLGELDTPHDRRAPNPDTEALDFLETAECNVFFNSKVEDGMWGVLDQANKLLGCGATIRSAIERAHEKEMQEALDVFRADAVAHPAQAVS